MVMNHDAGDVTGLEEVFRSQEISRASGGIWTGADSTTILPGTETWRLRKCSARRRGSAHHRDTMRHGRPVRSVGHVVTPRATALDAARHAGPVRGGLVGRRRGEGSKRGRSVWPGPPWKRQSSRYRTIAAFSAVVALVVAGVIAGTVQHGPSNRSAQGAHGTARPGSGLIALPGTGSTGPTAPGSLTGAIGSGALALGTPSAGARNSGNEPGGHVTLTGAASVTGTLSPPGGGSPGGGSPGGGSPGGGSPGSSGSNPVSPVAAGVGNTVATVGTSVTGLANQLGSSVPATAPATNAASGAVSGVLASVDQAVSATTL